MPIVAPPAKILVSGASGFIAAWISKSLLEQGYNVVGTVRSKAKGEYLERLYQKDGFGKDRFSFVIVEDMEKEGAFDQAVSGVDAVLHTASPVTVDVGDPQEVIGPALRGTKGILESVRKHGTSVKRFIFTSSCAAIYDNKPVLDETCWNTLSLKLVEEKGRDAPGMHKYRVSKIVAERAAWEFMAENKSTLQFDLVTICPPIVWGPTIHEGSSETVIAFKNGICTPGQTEQQLAALAFSGYWVDVRDVAAIHVLALANPKAGGERFITSSGPNAWQDFLDVIHTAGLPGSTAVTIGFPGKGKAARENVPFKLLSTKAEKTFNYKFRTLEGMAPDTLRSLQERGY